MHISYGLSIADAASLFNEYEVVQMEGKLTFNCYITSIDIHYHGNSLCNIKIELLTDHLFDLFSSCDL